MSQSVINILDERPMSPGQYRAILVCILLAAFDGFDIAAIAYASPGIAEEWGLSKGVLGWVITMELIGMAFGSAVLGNLADRIGRRPVTLLCVILITVGMYAAAIAPNVYFLSISRIVTGMGIGAVLACGNAMIAELSNTRNRNTLILIMTASFGVGAVVGGLISTELLKVFDWRSVFLLGAAGTTIVFPLALFFLPESISFLARKQPPGALEKINVILGKYALNPVSALPEKSDDESKTGFSLLFGPGFCRITILLSLAYLAHVATYYFVLKWIPKLVVDMGYSASQGSSVLVWAQLGTLAGALSLAFIARLFDIRKLVITMMLAAAFFVIVFGQANNILNLLVIAAIVSAFFNSAAAAGFYPLIADYYPTEARAGGTGVVIAIGRGGAVAGPVIAGYLLEANISLEYVTMLLSLGSLSAAVAIWILGPKPAPSIS